MAVLTQKSSVRTNCKISKRTQTYLSILLVIVCFVTPILLITLDPLHALVHYLLRLRPGSYMYSILSNEFEGPRLTIYPFNISNADRFISGEDNKLKLEEVGPFVYQEYRWYEDMRLNVNSTEMAMTSRYRTEFLLEESVGHPKDINMTVGNIPLLSLVAIVSTYPSFLRFMFNNMAAQTNSKVITNINVQDYFWGYKNPLLSIVNKLLPGVVYYDSFGLMDRFYDKESDYRLVVGATDQDRFRIKYVKKFRNLHQKGIDDVDESQQNFLGTDTYEGLGYPQELTPEVPINWYRIPFCRTFELVYQGSETMEYGGEGQVYTLSNSTFTDEINTITKKLHPYGLMDISKCYFGMPFAVSKPHFLEADAKLLEAVEGLKPDRQKYVNRVVIDRRAAVTYNTRLSLQMNIVLDDISYNWEARKFSNTVLPILRIQVDQPPMPKERMLLFYLIYKLLPWLFIVIEVALVLSGAIILVYAIRSMCFNKSNSLEVSSKEKSIQINTTKPLIVRD